MTPQFTQVTISLLRYGTEGQTISFLVFWSTKMQLAISPMNVLLCVWNDGKRWLDGSDSFKLRATPLAAPILITLQQSTLFRRYSGFQIHPILRHLPSTASLLFALLNLYILWQNQNFYTAFSQLKAVYVLNLISLTKLVSHLVYSNGNLELKANVQCLFTKKLKNCLLNGWKVVFLGQKIFDPVTYRVIFVVSHKRMFHTMLLRDYRGWSQRWSAKNHTHCSS